jgi:hypothetical protein
MKKNTWEVYHNREKKAINFLNFTSLFALRSRVNDKAFRSPEMRRHHSVRSHLPFAI